MIMRTKLSIYLINIEKLGYIVSVEGVMKLSYLVVVELGEDVEGVVVLGTGLEGHVALLGVHLDDVEHVDSALGPLPEPDLHDSHLVLILQVLLAFPLGHMHPFSLLV